jgi:hypothetical protein
MIKLKNENKRVQQSELAQTKSCRATEAVLASRRPGPFLGHVRRVVASLHICSSTIHAAMRLCPAVGHLTSHESHLTQPPQLTPNVFVSVVVLVASHCRRGRKRRGTSSIISMQQQTAPQFCALQGSTMTEKEDGDGQAREREAVAAAVGWQRCTAGRCGLRERRRGRLNES